jgi:hypothetical protein
MQNFTLPKGPCNFLNLRISPWEVLFLLLLCFSSLSVLPLPSVSFPHRRRFFWGLSLPPSLCCFGRRRAGPSGRLAAQARERARLQAARELRLVRCEQRRRAGALERAAPSSGEGGGKGGGSGSRGAYGSGSAKSGSGGHAGQRQERRQHWSVGGAAAPAGLALRKGRLGGVS